MSLLNPRQWPEFFQRLVGLGPLQNVVALHSKKIHLSASCIEHWYNSAISWMYTLGHEPKSIATQGLRGFKDYDVYDFKSVDSTLRKRGFNNITYISLMARPTVGPIFPISADWEPKIEADISCVSHKLTEACHKLGHSHITWAWENSKRALSRNAFLSLIEAIQWQDKTDYALAYQEHSERMAVINAKKDPFATNSVRKSGHIIGCAYPTNYLLQIDKHPLDFLREVYPYQILSPVHLAYPLGNQTLREWISASDSHGTLEAFSEDRWLWTIPDTQLKFVRKVLSDHYSSPFHQRQYLPIRSGGLPHPEKRQSGQQDLFAGRRAPGSDLQQPGNAVCYVFPGESHRRGGQRLPAGLDR